MASNRQQPADNAENLIGNVFARLEAEADPQMARLHLENQLKQQAPRQRPSPFRLRLGYRLALYAVALFLVLGWASQQEVASWDDGQLITLAAPAAFQPSAYPHYVGMIANHAAELHDVGGHSLIVDFEQGQDGRYYIQLGIIGINYTQANSWLRDLMEAEPEFAERPYAITQPLLSFGVTAQEKIAFDLLGKNYLEEYKVMKAWRTAGEQPRMIYLIADLGKTK